MPGAVPQWLELPVHSFSDSTGILNSRAWIVYWLTHALYLLGAEPGYDICTRIVSQLRHMQNATGKDTYHS